MIDMVSMMQMTKPGFAMADGSYTVLIPQDASGFGRLVQVKNHQGFPVDIILYNDHGLWDRLTERDKPGWSNPSDVKLHTGNGGLGTLICPRFVSSFPTVPSLTDVASYEPFFSGQTDLVPKNVGAAKSIVSVETLNWGGELGQRLTYVRKYYWGGHGALGAITYSDLETYSYVPPFGMVHWTHAKLSPAGAYIVDIDPGIKNTTRPMPTKLMNVPIMLGGGAPVILPGPGPVVPPPPAIPALGNMTFTEAIATLKAMGAF